VRTSIEANTSVTTSFNINTLECHACEGHEELKPWRKKGSGNGEQHGEVFILADQSWPPVLPTKNAARCLKIIKREHGSIHELATEFLQLARGMDSQIKFALGGHVQVVPLPPLFLGGCKCPMTIRTVAEVARWASNTYGAEGLFLSNSFEKALEEIVVYPGNGGQEDYKRLVRLPQCIE
jgi:hypothetical protein